MKQSIRILNSRPAPQNQELTNLLQARGFQVSEFCPIFIEKTLTQPPRITDKQIALNLDHYSDVIVTSVFAADYGLEFLSDYWPQWPELRWWAIGDATAARLQTFQIQAQSPKNFGLPTEPNNSETLLKTLAYVWQESAAFYPQFRLNSQATSSQAASSQANTKVCLITGENGRGLIQDSLQQQGIALDEWSVYRRARIASQWQPAVYDAVILTSIDIAQGLLDTVQSFEHFGKNCHYICASERIASFVQSKGAMKVINSGSAKNQILCECADRLYP